MAQAELRLTRPAQQVLNALIARPGDDHHGTDLRRETGLGFGSIYPILVRLEMLGWVQSSWQDTGRREQGRPRRRHYRLTSDGLAFPRSALASRRAAAERLGRRLRPAGESA